MADPVGVQGSCREWNQKHVKKADGLVALGQWLRQRSDWLADIAIAAGFIRHERHPQIC